MVLLLYEVFLSMLGLRGFNLCMILSSVVVTRICLEIPVASTVFA